MIQAAKDNHVMLYVDLHKRLDPAHIQLKNAIKSGKLGEIEYGYVCMEDKILVPTEWFKTWAKNSSPAWFIGIHFSDLIYLSLIHILSPLPQHHFACYAIRKKRYK